MTFEIGSKVKIARAVVSVDGWKNSWTESMTELVGDNKVYTISRGINLAGVMDNIGVNLEDSEGKGVSFSWPLTAFDLVISDMTKSEITDKIIELTQLLKAHQLEEEEKKKITVAMIGAGNTFKYAIEIVTLIELKRQCSSEWALAGREGNPYMTFIFDAYKWENKQAVADWLNEKEYSFVSEYTK